MRDGREVAEFPDEIVHLDLDRCLAHWRGRKGTGPKIGRRLRKTIAFFIRCGILFQECHKAVLEPRRYRFCPDAEAREH